VDEHLFPHTDSSKAASLNLFVQDQIRLKKTQAHVLVMLRTKLENSLFCRLRLQRGVHIAGLPALTDLWAGPVSRG